MCSSTERRKSTSKASHLAAFIGNRPGRAVFVGIYRTDGQYSTAYEKRQQTKEWMELIRYGFPNHRKK